MKFPFALLSFLLLFACQNNSIEKETTPEEEHLPTDWMYNQRAYPHERINQEVYHEAVLQTLVAKEAVSFRDDAPEWELAGPINTGGRITDVALHPTNQNIIYVGASVGGVFKSSDAGQTWDAIFDDQSALSIGNIAVSESEPETVYVGTGEANGSATSGAFFGTGLFKTEDGGANWENIGLPNSQHVGRIIVHPNSSDTVFVAAAGLLYGKSPDKGVYRTTDGGDNWEKVLFISDSTSVIDVSMDPQNPDILYAASWERIRRPWQRSYGGVTSGIWRSMDGGDNWDLLTNGLPAGDPNTGRIGLASSKSQPGVVFATYTSNPITNRFAGLYRSQDYGDSWSRIDNGFDLENTFSSFGWFFGNVRVDPNNAQNLYVLGVPLMQSVDGGENWFQTAFSNHVDNHGLEIHPQNSNFIVSGNDGGVYISQDGGNDWQHVQVLPITQFYQAEIDNLVPERIYGGTQDNGTIRTLTGALDDWERILGGDGFHVIVDPVNNNNIYAESQWGNLQRSTNGGFSFDYSFGGGPMDRTNWNTPVVIDPSNPNRLYYGANILYRSENKGVDWQAISTDLTDGLHPSGSFAYGTITSIAVAPSKPEVIYVGTDDGNVQVSLNDGATWSNISAGVPDRYVTEVAVDPVDENTIYVTLSGYRLVDYQPHVLKSTDAGQNWEDISGNLPEVPVNDIIIDPDLLDTYYIANDLGVWYTIDAGENWEILDSNLPLTIVNDLVFHAGTRKMVAATFGRSIQKIDLSELISSSKSPIQDNQVLGIFPNPVSGQATIQLDLKNNQAASLEVFSMSGQKVQALPFTNFIVGANTLTWDFSSLAAGSYFLRFSSKEKIATKKFQVVK